MMNNFQLIIFLIFLFIFQYGIPCISITIFTLIEPFDNNPIL